MMKRLFVFYFIVCFLFFTGCGKKSETTSGRFNVVASFYPVYIIAKNVSKEVPGMVLTNLTPPVTGCLHDYSITAADMKKLEKADLLQGGYKLLRF